MFYIGEVQWKGAPGNIPNEPFVIVVPVNLVHQLTSELHRYLQHGYFDIFPYVGTWKSRKRWWLDVWTKGKNPPGRKILITTPTVRPHCIAFGFGDSTLTILMNRQSLRTLRWFLRRTVGDQ